MISTEKIDLLPVESVVPEVVQHGWRVRLVVIVVGLYFTGYSLSLPIGVQYVYFRMERQYGLLNNTQTSVCYVNKSDPAYQAQEKAQEDSSQWQQYTSLAGGIPSVVTALILGSYSDKIGRRWLFLAPTVGALLRTSIYTAISFWSLPLILIIPAWILDGLFGGFVTFFAASFAYTSDITKTGASRTLLVTAIEAVVGIAYTLSSVLGGYLIKSTGYTIPFLVSATFLLCNSIIIFFLTETNRPVETRKNGLRHYIWRIFRFYVTTENDNPRLIYQLSLLVFFLALTVAMGMIQVISLYFLNAPFCWDSVKLGNYIAISLALSSVITVILVKVLQRCLSDTIMGTIGALLAAISVAVTGLASTDIMAYIATGIKGFSPYISMIRVILSKISAPDEQGAVYSSIASIEAIAQVVGGVVFTAVYKETLLYYRGIVFFVMATLFLITTALYIVLHVLLKRHVKQHGLRSVTNPLPEPIVCEVDYEPIIN